jgi:hypothetical protein
MWKCEKGVERFSSSLGGPWQGLCLMNQKCIKFKNLCTWKTLRIQAQLVKFH